MINEKNIIERNKEKKKEESKMKETCKIKHSTSDISEYYCYSIGKDLDGLLEKCIQFPKAILLRSGINQRLHLQPNIEILLLIRHFQTLNLHL